MYLISQLAKTTDLSTDAIRFYEKKGLIHVSFKADNQYKYYNEATLQRLIFIKNCRNVDLSIDEIKTLIEKMDNPEACCLEVNRLIEQHIHQLDQKITQLLKFRKQLTQMNTACEEIRTIKECMILKTLEEKQF